MGRQIIGPVLFPAYQRVLAWNLALTFGIILIIFGCLLIAGENLTAQGAVSVVFYQFLIQFSVITLIFAFVDRHIVRHPDQWCAQRPHTVQMGPELGEKIERDIRTRIAEECADALLGVAEGIRDLCRQTRKSEAER